MIKLPLLGNSGAVHGSLLLLLATAIAWLAPSQVPDPAPTPGPAASATEIAHAPVPTSTTFRADDGVTLHADLYAADDAGRPWVLLFHQAGANARAEYGPLVGRLLEAGLRVVAPDLRNGGSRLGGTNRTVEDLLPGANPSYCEGYADLEATLAWLHARDPGARPVIWGSSYSAALALRLAAEHPEQVRGVLAFSPASGDPMGDCQPLPSARSLAPAGVPTLVLRPASEMESGRVRAQMGEFRDLGLGTWVADPGAHGSSMLNPGRAAGDVEPTWRVVLDFLSGLVDEGPAGEGGIAGTPTGDGSHATGPDPTRAASRRPAPDAS